MKKENTENKAKESTIEVEAVETVKYPVADFLYAGKNVFGREISPDIIKTAFDLAGIKEASKEEAVKIVKEFCEREVK